MAIRDNIIALRDTYGITQTELAKIAGVTRAAVSQWEGGFSEPRMGAIERMASHFGIRKSEIIEGFGKDGYTCVPLLGSISAGSPMEMREVDDFFPIPEKLHSRYPHSFMLHVVGDSMNRTIPNGCLALVDPDDTIPDRHGAFAVAVNGYDATIKRVRRLANGYELMPDSFDPTQRPIIFDYNNAETDKVTVIGRVVWITAPFDYEI